MFGSSKKTYVGTSAVRLVEDEMVPNSAKKGLIEYVLSSDQSEGVTPYILDSSMRNLGTTQRNAYKFALESLPYGVPTKTFNGRNRGVDEAKILFSRKEGEDVNIMYSKYGLPNFYHWGWEHIFNKMSYNQETGELPAMSNAETIVFLKSVTLHLDEREVDKYDRFVLERWLNPFKPTAVNIASGDFDIGVNIIRSNVYDQAVYGSGSSVSMVVTVIRVRREKATTQYLENLTVYAHTHTEETVSIPLPVLSDSSANYYQIHYKLRSGKSRLITYQENTGAYPELDGIKETKPTLGQFYPWIYFRHEKKKLNEAPYKQSKDFTASDKYCKKIGLNYEDLIESIHQNPDINDVEQAFLMYGFTADTEDALERAYLFEFFEGLFKELPANTDQLINVPTDSYEYSMGSLLNVANDWAYTGYKSSAGTDGMHAIEIKDGKSSIALLLKGITKRVDARTIGKIGFVTVEQKVVKRYINVTQGNGDAGDIVVQETVEDHFFEYIKQTTSATCEVVSVCNLNTRFNVYENYQTIGDEEKETNLIPLDFSIVQRFPSSKRERLIARSMRLIFNSRVVVKVKWYQSTFFQFLMLVAAAVLAVVSYGTSVKAFFAGVAAGSITAVAALQTILGVLFKALMFDFAFKFVVEKLGGELAAIFAIVLLVYGGYKGMQAGGSFSNFFTQLGTGLIQSTASFYEDAISAIGEEMDLLKETFDTLFEELNETSKDLLYKNTHLAPLIIFGESPNEFYDRTVHSGNIAVKTLQFPEKFVETSLKLPDGKQPLYTPTEDEQ